MNTLNGAKLTLGSAPWFKFIPMIASMRFVPLQDEQVGSSAPDQDDGMADEDDEMNEEEVEASDPSK